MCVYRILVVEDEFLIAMELDNILRTAGYEVVGPVPNVSGALHLLVGERPDAAVLDVSLEGEPVTPVAEVLRAMLVPFVLASAYGVTADAEPVLRNTINVGKSSRSDQLLRELSNMLRAEDPRRL